MTIKKLYVAIKASLTVLIFFSIFFITQSYADVSVGDLYEGGTVFCVSQTPDITKCEIQGSGKYGLIMANEDQADYDSLNNGVAWATEYKTTGARSYDDGAANTEAIIAVHPKDNPGNNAAWLCRSYKGGGKEDWYLPSKNELNKMYLYAKANNLIGKNCTGCKAGGVQCLIREGSLVINGGHLYYWSSTESSTEYNNYGALCQCFNCGDQHGYSKTYGYIGVRAIRAFNNSTTQQFNGLLSEKKDTIEQITQKLEELNNTALRLQSELYEAGNKSATIIKDKEEEITALKKDLERRLTEINNLQSGSSEDARKITNELNSTVLRLQDELKELNTVALNLREELYAQGNKSVVIVEALEEKIKKLEDALSSTTNNPCDWDGVSLPINSVDYKTETLVTHYSTEVKASTFMNYPSKLQIKDIDGVREITHLGNGKYWLVFLAKKDELPEEVKFEIITSSTELRSCDVRKNAMKYFCYDNDICKVGVLGDFGNPGNSLDFYDHYAIATISKDGKNKKLFDEELPKLEAKILSHSTDNDSTLKLINNQGNQIKLSKVDIWNKTKINHKPFKEINLLANGQETFELLQKQEHCSSEKDSGVAYIFFNYEPQKNKSNTYLIRGYFSCENYWYKSILYYPWQFTDFMLTNFVPGSVTKITATMVTGALLASGAYCWSRIGNLLGWRHVP